MIRRRLTITAAAVGLALLPTAAEAATRGSFYAECPMPRAVNPWVRTAWTERIPATSTVGPWEPIEVRVDCTSRYCDPITTAVGDVYDGTTGGYLGTVVVTLPAGWKQGARTLPRYTGVRVPHAHTPVMKWTLWKGALGRSQYCQATNRGFVPQA